MPALDKLTIQVEADTASATRKINNLSRALENLSVHSYVGSIDTTAKALQNIATATTGMGESATATRQMGSSLKAFIKSLDGATEAAEGAKSLPGLFRDLDTATQAIDVPGMSLAASTTTLMSGSIKGLVKSMDGVDAAAESAKALPGMFRELSSASQAVDLTAIQQLINASVELRSAGSGFASFARSINTVGESMEEVEVRAGRLEMFIYKINEASQAVDISKLLPIVEFANTVKTVGSGLNGFTRALESLAKFTSDQGKVGAFITSLDTIIGKLVERQPELTALSMTLKDITAGLKALDKAGDVGEKMQQAQKETRKFGFELKDLTKSSRVMELIKSKIHGIVGAVGKLISSIKRIAFYRMIRSLIRSITSGFSEGIKHLYEWARATNNVFKASMDSMSTSAHYLRDSLGAMASPLIDALAPAIEFVVDKFVALLNIVNQFIATFTGATSWRRAVRTPTEYSAGLEDAANSAKKATEAQKKLNKALMDFDEIHLITTSTSGGSNPSSPSGGGGGGDDYSTHFVEEPIADWIQAIKDAIDNGDWYGAGAMLADKLNGIIDNWDAEAWGRKLGEKIQHGIEFYLGFMDTFHWEGLGGKIADFLNGLIDEVNPNDLGRAIVAKFNAAIGFLNGFTKQFNWDDAGKWLADVIVGAFTGLNWGTLGELVKNLAGGLLAMIKAGLSELWSRKGEILDSIGDFFSNLGWDGLSNVVQLAAIVAGFKILFGTIFGDSGLIQSVKNSMSGLLSGAASGLGTFYVLLALELTRETAAWISEMQEKGLTQGTIDYFHIDSGFSLIGWFGGTTGLATLSGELRNALKEAFDFDPSNLGFFKKAIEIFNAILAAFGSKGLTVPGEDNSGSNLPTSSTPTISQNNYGAMYDPTTGSWFIPASASGSVPPLPSVPSGSLPDTAYGSQFLGDMADKSKALKDNLDAINNTPYTVTMKTVNVKTTANTIKTMTGDKTVTIYANKNKKTFDAVTKAINALSIDRTATIKFKPVVQTSNNRGGLTSSVLDKKQLTKILNAYATGGFPSDDLTQGSLFVAGEMPGQAEMVGNINGKTGVASGREITGIADAVYETGASEAELLREQNRLLRQLLAKKSEVTLAPNVAAGKWVNQAQQAYARASG